MTPSFCCLFIVVAGLEKTHLVQWAWQKSASRLAFSNPEGIIWLTASVTIGANLLSNLPMVLLTGPYLGALGSEQLGWVLLAFITTVAGNFTLLGSVANIIVAEGARDRYALGFWEYLRFGVVSTILVLTLGVGLIAWLMPV